MANSQPTSPRLYLMQVVMVPSVPCYLVQTQDGKNVLIDSGLPRTFPEGFQRPAAIPEPQYSSDVVEQLAELGLQPADIDILICTHFDMDHTGYHDMFTSAELVVQRAHYEFARSGYQRYAPSREHWDRPALNYRLIDGDIELLPGIELIETSGHGRGHQSVLVRLPETGAVLLTIDAVTVQQNFRPDRELFHADDGDLETVRASTRKLIDIAERERALVIFGHDAEQWQTLKKAPEFYS